MDHGCASGSTGASGESLILGGFIKFPKILRAEYMKSCCWKGAYPGVEAPITPDELDVLDGGDGVEGTGAGLSGATGSSS